MREDVRKILTEQSAKPTAREVLWPLIEAMPLGDRLDPLLKEVTWVLMGKQNPEEHEFILPAYCYDIFEKSLHTVFQAFPKLSETVICPDPSKLANVKSYEEAKQFVELDWFRLGKAIGILMRMIRFLNLEIEDKLKEDGLWDLNPARENDMITMIGLAWLEKKSIQLANLTGGDLSATLANNFKGIAPNLNFQEIWSNIAFQFGPEAMAELNRGIVDGIKGFLDTSGELAGESTATSNHCFFLILWPEIKEMLERDQLPYRPEVFEWITPFHEAGFVCIPNIGYFNNFCESIGLKFAGRPPKKF
jgi:hypothetical protein